MNYCALNKTVGKIFYGYGPPSQCIGNNNDFYVDIDRNYLYGPKVNYHWSKSYIILQGLPGEKGINGPDGEQGFRGPIGTSCHRDVIIVNNLFVSETVDVQNIYVNNVFVTESIYADSMTIINLDIADDLFANSIIVENIDINGNINADNIIANVIYVNELTTNQINVDNIVVNESIDVESINSIDVHAINTTGDELNVTNIIADTVNVNDIYVTNITANESIYIDNINANDIDVESVTMNIMNVVDVNITGILNFVHMNVDDLNVDNIIVNIINTNNITVEDITDITNIITDDVTTDIINTDSITVEDITATNLTLGGINVANDIYANNFIAKYSFNSAQFNVGPLSDDYTSYFKDIYPLTSSAYSIGIQISFGNLYLQENPIITSDFNKKKLISNCDLGIDFINKLRTVKYQLKDNPSNKFNCGMIAQEVRDVNPEFPGYINNNNGHFLRYSEFIAPLIKANQEMYNILKKMNDKLDMKIANLTNN